jgi:Ca-activated chloride channel family protein
METTYADIVERGRHEIEVTFVTRRAVECNDERIHRLLVTDTTGTQFALLVAPDGDALPDLATGERYRFVGLLGAAPIETTSHDDWTCPACDGALRRGQATDAAGWGLVDAVARFDLTDRFGIVDAETAVQHPERDTATEEWTPRPESERPTVPDYVCTACGCHVDQRAAEGTPPSAQAGPRSK